jgi:hypothetical protein
MASEQPDMAKMAFFRLEVDLIYAEALDKVARAAENYGVPGSAVGETLSRRVGECIAEAWDERAREISEDEEDRG